MEFRWRDLVVCDYEMSLIDGVSGRGAVVEYDLYGRGLHTAPRILLGSPNPLGKIRRPGIVDVPAAEYDAFCTAVRQRLLRLDGALAIRQAFDTTRAGFEEMITQLEGYLSHAEAAPHLEALAVVLDNLMALHTLNWLLPRTEAEAHLATLFDDEAAARACLLALTVPTDPAHLVDVHAWLLQTARSSDASAFAERMGFLQQQGLSPSAWEDPATVAQTIRRIPVSETEQALTELQEHHTRANQRRADLYAAALLASVTDRSAYERTQAIAVSCRLAADEEEFRKVAQQRTLRALRKLADRHGWDAYEMPLSQFISLMQEVTV